MVFCLFSIHALNEPPILEPVCSKQTNCAIMAKDMKWPD